MVVDIPEADADPRLDALLRASDQIWPETDEALDSWLAGQKLSDEDEVWLREVIQRRLAEAAGPSGPTTDQAVGTPVGEPSGFTFQGAVVVKAHAPAPAEPDRPAAAVRPRPTPRRLSYEDLALLNRQLLELVESGIALPSGLSVYAGDLKAGRLEQVLRELREDLEAGRPLSESMARRGEALPPLYRSLVAAGEAGGDLTTCLALLHEQAEVDADLDRRVRESLAYPAATFGFAVVGLLLVIAWIGPQFKDIFSNMGVTLPWVTKALLSFSEALGNHPLVTGVFVIGTFWGAGKYLPRLFPWVVRIVAGGVPGRPLGELSRALSGFLGRGLPLPAALEALGAADLSFPQGTLDRVLERLREGSSLADALRPEPAFPSTYVWLVGAAEARGDLPAALQALARRHERAYASRLRLLEALVAPVALACLGVFVAVGVLSLFLPIFELQRALQQ